MESICTSSSRRREATRQIEVNEIVNVGEQEHRGVEVIRYGAKGGMEWYGKNNAAVRAIRTVSDLSKKLSAVFSIGKAPSLTGIRLPYNNM